MAGRALVVHATNLLVRGYAMVDAERTTPSGEPANALYALIRGVVRALAFRTPDVAVALVDSETERDGWPPRLVAQAERLPALLAAHHIPVVVVDRPEHVTAAYVQAAVDAGYDVIVAGSDKRLAQLVSERVWWYDPYKDVRYTPELVKKRFSVGPERVAEWLALVGDDDALPGVKGIGAKGATGLIERFGSVASAIEHAGEVEGRTGKALRASLDAARRELARARLDRTARPIRPLEELAYQPPDPAALHDLYDELGFLELLAAHDGQERPEVQVCDTPERVRELLGRLTREPVAVHALTEDPSPVRGALAGVALAQGGTIAYLPFSGSGRALADGPALLAELLADEERPKIGHDLKAAAVAFARDSIALRGIVGDSACASHLSEPSNLAPHDLPRVARHVLRRAVRDEEAVRGVGQKRKAWASVPIARAAEHAGEMAQVAAELWHALAPTTDRELLAEYLALSDTLVRMELRGIACDRGDLARAGQDFTAAAAEIEEQIFELAGKRFNLGSTKQLGAVLYEDLGLTIVKRTKTGWSTATDALERIAGEHPIVPLVMRWRLLRRLTDSWVTTLSDAIDSDGRIHSTFHPARSFSGQLVSTNPDLGRVPGKTPEMARIRHAFRAPPKTVLLSVDYNQLGLHVLAHLTGDAALVEPLSRRADMHTLTAAHVLELAMEEVGPDERQLGKVVNFATFAGQGASALAQQLGVSAEDAKRIIARFDQRYAVVRRFQDEQLELVRKQGYIVTLAGRRWPIGGLDTQDPMLRSYAERLARRATHEGSVADVSRRGLLRADQALRAAGLGAAPLLQVHDEVLFEVPEDELEDAARIAAAAMKSAFELAVPLQVGCEAGPSWAELEPLPEPA